MTKHGMAKTPLYGIWKGMRKRCINNPGDYRTKYYGQRGIHVCDAWQNNFTPFYEWAIESGYRPGLSIDRIDVNGDYCPENCRWATIKEQDNNRRSNHRLTIDGVTRNVTEWSSVSGVKDITIFARLKRGWSAKDAVFGKVRVDVLMIEADGRVHSISEWSNLIGVSKGRIFHRLQEGWSEHDAVMTPSLKQKKHRFRRICGVDWAYG